MVMMIMMIMMMIKNKSTVCGDVVSLVYTNNSSLYISFGKVRDPE